MGEIFFGRDVKLERPIAVKFVRFRYGDYDEELVRRFVRESRITARLEHPGVPAVYDVGIYDGRPFLVMQRIHGITVADLIAEQGPLPIGWTTAIAAQVCSVLSAAHTALLLHRDLKPANLMLEPDGCVKVLDFGLAAAGLPEFSKITGSGDAQPGTAAYMAPEQLLEGVSVPGSDLYALGVTMYEMLSGEQLFQGDTAYAVMNAQVGFVPASVTEIRADVPEVLDRLLTALLQKDPLNRPSDAYTVYSALLPLVEDCRPIPGIVSTPQAGAPRRTYSVAVARLLNPEQRAVQRSRSTGDIIDVRPGSQDIPVQADLIDASVSESVSTPVEQMKLADRLFDEGHYEQAAEAYALLIKQSDLETLTPEDLAFRARLREATCRALTGQSLLALRQMTDLLEDQRQALSPDDDRTLLLRRQIALLQLSAGQHSAARSGLRELLSDLTQLRGPEHPQVVQLRRDLEVLPSGKG